MKTTSVTLRRIRRPGPKGRDREEWVLRWFDSAGRHRSEKLADVKVMPKREAEARRRAKQVDMEARRIPRDRPQAITLEQFVEFHEQAVGEDRAASTRYEYRIAIQHAASALGSDRPIGRITVSDVGHIKNAMTCSATTKGKTIARLRAMFNRAKDWGLVTENPFAKQTMPPPSARAKRIFHPDEITAMLNASSTTWWKAFIQLGYTSGLRWQELLHLQWRDVDARKKTVRVAGKAAKEVGDSRRPGYRALEWAPKTHQQRVVPIPVATVVGLRELEAESDGSLYCFLSVERLVALEAKRRAGQLRDRFQVVNNVLRGFQSIQRRAAKARDRDDWVIGSVHDLRRSYGTRLADTVPMHVLQRWMGHSDISVTSRYYLSISDHHADVARATFTG